ncbi:MAG TPA: transposase [Parachlamydiaceae bacterium]|nr:transposase [Parachlamydiaceae bacterium]
MTNNDFEWPKTPSRKLHEKGTLAVTGETCKKAHLFDTPKKMDGVLQILLKLALEFKWQLEAWSLFSNHYHILISSRTPENLDDFIEAFHLQTTEMLNSMESVEKRKVWSQYSVNKIIMQASYYAFQNYIHYNSLKHGKAIEPTKYRWCSAAWFESVNEEEYVIKIKSFGSKSFGINNLTIADDFA